MEGLQNNAGVLPRVAPAVGAVPQPHPRPRRRRRRSHKTLPHSKSVSALSRPASDAHSLDDSADGAALHAVLHSPPLPSRLSSGAVDVSCRAGAEAIQLVAPPCQDCGVAPRSVLFFCCLKLRVCGRCMRRRIAGLNQPLIGARALGQRRSESLCVLCSVDWCTVRRD